MSSSEILIQQSQTTEHSLWIEVDTSAIRHNLTVLKNFLSPAVDILAVVKANAYGHGLVAIAEVLSDEVEYFGVYSVAEASELRRGGLRNRILILGCPAGEEILRALEGEVTLSVSDLKQAEQIEEAAIKAGRRACVHIHVDTGMGRLGIRHEEAERLVERVARLPRLFIEGLYTHFASAGSASDVDFTLRQVELFQALIHRLARVGFEFPFVHAANSAGLLNFPEAHFNLVRPGLALYGVHVPTFRECERKTSGFPFKPALSLKARLVHLKAIRRGETVGYGRSFRAGQDTVVGVLPVGYSHGYPFQLSPRKGRILFRGRSFPVIGRICMDQLMVDMGNDSSVDVGSPVTLIGKDGDEEIKVEDLAAKIGTISHEITARLHPDIPRIYL